MAGAVRPADRRVGLRARRLGGSGTAGARVVGDVPGVGHAVELHDAAGVGGVDEPAAADVHAFVTHAVEVDEVTGLQVGLRDVAGGGVLVRHDAGQAHAGRSPGHHGQA